MAASDKWLRTSRTPASSLALGLLWLLLALGQWWFYLDSQTWLRGALAVLNTVLALLYLAPVPLRLRQGEPFRSPDGRGGWMNL